MAPDAQDWLWYCGLRDAPWYRLRLQKPKVTGWRWVRGSHGGCFVPDAEGTDAPPAGYFDPVQVNA